MHMNTMEFTKDNFESEVLKSDRPVLVDFMATWCGFCKMIAPAVEKIAEDHPEIKVGKLNVDNEPEIADRYQIMTYPTIMLIKNGVEVKRIMAPKSRDQILELMKGQA
jgi:thioredoxin 1